MSRSDEEILQEMDTGELSYRFGWPQLPPLPLDTIIEGARDFVQNGSDILESVKTILEAQRVYAFAVYFAYRVPRDIDVAETLESYHTLVITIDSAVPNNLQQSIIQVRQLLKRNEDTQETFIELIDYRAISGLFTRAVRHHDASVLLAWESASEITMNELEKHDAMWLSIEIAYRGLLEHRCSPTIIITTPTASDGVWRSDIMPALRSRLTSIVPLLGVEILCGVTLMRTKSTTTNAASYDKNATMGASIGIPGDGRHAGTAGGFLTLQDGNILALTNHHVARDERIDSSKFNPIVSCASSNRNV
jgi:hypothetical protein